MKLGSILLCLLVVTLFVLGSCTTFVPTGTDSLDTALMGRENIPEKSFVSYLLTRNPQADPVWLRRIHREYLHACTREGVKMSVALAQMIHETNFLLFTGTVSQAQHNFAGLGTVSVTQPGNSFPDIETGVLAHVQHLKAYGSKEPLNLVLVDPRFRYVQRGSAPTLGDLTGKWASDPHYAQRLLDHLYRLKAATRTW